MFRTDSCACAGSGPRSKVLCRSAASLCLSAKEGWLLLLPPGEWDTWHSRRVASDSACKVVGWGCARLQAGDGCSHEASPLILFQSVLPSLSCPFQRLPKSLWLTYVPSEQSPTWVLLETIELLACAGDYLPFCGSNPNSFLLLLLLSVGLNQR